MTLNDLYTIITSRKKNLPAGSYVTSLFKKGSDAILQKIGEETTEVIIAAKNKSKKEIISETADLWFHLLVLLSYFNLPLDSIWQELAKRKKVSK